MARTPKKTAKRAAVKRVIKRRAKVTEAQLEAALEDKVVSQEEFEAPLDAIVEEMNGQQPPEFTSKGMVSRSPEVPAGEIEIVSSENIENTVRALTIWGMSAQNGLLHRIDREASLHETYSFSDFKNYFAWFPVKTLNAGRVWLTWTIHRRVTVDVHTLGDYGSQLFTRKTYDQYLKAKLAA